MMLYEPVAKFMANDFCVFAITRVCAFGAPWTKPTLVVANCPEIHQIIPNCTCTKPHLSLFKATPLLGSHGPLLQVLICLNLQSVGLHALVLIAPILPLNAFLLLTTLDLLLYPPSGLWHK